MCSEKTIIDLIAKSSGYKPDEISRDTNFDTDLSYDDLSMAILISDIEEWLDICIFDEDMKGIYTVGQFVDYVQQQLNKKAGNE